MVGIQLVSKVGEKGQIVIPKPIRQKFNISPNTEVVFDVDEEKIFLKKRKSDADLIEEFVSAVKNKIKFPKKIDWDEEYYSQYD